MTITPILLVIIIVIIHMFFRIELNIQNSVISWRIQQMTGIRRPFIYDISDIV